MTLRVDPAGHGPGDGTHLSVFLYLMKGPHNDMLTWPLRGKVGLTLLNQIHNSRHCSRLVIYNEYVSQGRVTANDKDASGWGLPKLISNEDLYKVTPTCQYLKDDCAFFRISKI